MEEVLDEDEYIDKDDIKKQEEKVDNLHKDLDSFETAKKKAQEAKEIIKKMSILGITTCIIVPTIFLPVLAYYALNMNSDILEVVGLSKSFIKASIAGVAITAYTFDILLVIIQNKKYQKAKKVEENMTNKVTLINKNIEKETNKLDNLKIKYKEQQNKKRKEENDKIKLTKKDLYELKEFAERLRSGKDYTDSPKVKTIYPRGDNNGDASTSTSRGV